MKKETKRFTIDGKYMQFDSTSFKRFFDAKRKKLEKSVLEYEMELGDVLNVSNSAIHNWRFGTNGPSDVKTIKQLADTLEISDYQLLLKDGKEHIAMQISERQKDSLKRVYDAVMDFLELFNQTDGFNNWWLDLYRKGMDPKRIERKLNEMAEDEQHKVEFVLMKEYIELHNLPVYSQLEEYVSEDLGNTYDQKLSYAYRFEAGVENVDGTCDTVTTEEDYTKALKRINEILEEYM